MKLILETEGLEYTLLQGSREIEVENLVYDSLDHDKSLTRAG